MYLMALRDAAVRDITQASYQYGLTRSELEEFAALSFDSIQSIASRMDQSMVKLRYSVGELRELSGMPTGLAALVAAGMGQ